MKNSKRSEEWRVESGEWRREREGERERVEVLLLFYLFRKIEARWVQELL